MENYLSELYERDLLKLRAELEKFKDEANIWKSVDGITNPAGVLTKHLLGNLNAYIGETICRCWCCHQHLYGGQK